MLDALGSLWFSKWRLIDDSVFNHATANRIKKSPERSEGRPGSYATIYHECTTTEKPPVGTSQNSGGELSDYRINSAGAIPRNTPHAPMPCYSVAISHIVILPAVKYILKNVE